MNQVFHVSEEAFSALYTWQNIKLGVFAFNSKCKDTKIQATILYIHIDIAKSTSLSLSMLYGCS